MISVIDDFRGAAAESVDRHWRSNLEIREKRPPSQWAEAERYIGRGASPLSKNGDIKYRFDICPWVREPTDSAVDPEVQILVLQWASAMMKTDGVGSNIIGWSMTESPVNIQVTFPTEDRRDQYSRDVIDAGLIASTPCLRELLPTKKSRDAGNTIAYKRYPGGSLSMVGAGSVSSFRGPRIGCSWNAEVDGMKGAVGQEGDPVFLSLKRCEGFPDAIKVIEGTPTIKNHSRVEWWLLQSDRRMWFVPCRSCGTFQVLMWSQRSPAQFHNLIDHKPIPHMTVAWPKLGRNRFEKAVVLCNRCGISHNDNQRVRSVLEGEWKPTAPFSGIRGYFLNGINSTLPPEKGFRHKLHQFAVDAHRARHSQNPRETIKVWVNTFLAETYQEESNTKAEWRSVYDRREEYAAL